MPYPTSLRSNTACPSVITTELTAPLSFEQTSISCVVVLTSARASRVMISGSVEDR